MSIDPAPSPVRLISRTPSFGWSIVSLILLAGPLCFAQNTRPSPFVARGGQNPTSPPAAQAPADAILEFSGVTKIGGTTLVCITTLSDKRSTWIEVGKIVSGIHAVSYQADTGTATVRQNGREVTLPIKQPTYAPGSLVAVQPMMPSGPAPVASVAPVVAVTNEEKETEARMLVSDLLEIGMIQRKAYQEAQTREQEEKRAQIRSGQSGAPVPPGAPPQTAPQ